MSFLTSQLRSYTTEGGAGRDFVKNRNVDVILNNIVYICTLNIQFLVVISHIAISLKTYHLFKKSLVRRCLGLMFAISAVVLAIIFVISDSVTFLQYYYESPDPVQWLVIYPLIPALVSSVLLTLCWGCSLFCCWKIRNSRKLFEVFFCNPIAFFICIVTLPLTLLVNSLLFWSLMGIAMYPFQVGLGAILIFSPTCLSFFLTAFYTQQFITSIENKNSPKAPKTTSPNIKHTQMFSRLQLIQNISFLYILTSVMFAFFIMYYMLLIWNKLINYQNPVQSFLSVLFPTAVFTAALWGMRRIQRTTSTENGNIEHTNVSHGTDTNDEDSSRQSARNEQVHKNEANLGDQEEEDFV